MFFTFLSAIELDYPDHFLEPYLNALAWDAFRVGADFLFGVSKSNFLLGVSGSGSLSLLPEPLLLPGKFWGGVRTSLMEEFACESDSLSDPLELLSFRCGVFFGVLLGDLCCDPDAIGCFFGDLTFWVKTRSVSVSESRFEKRSGVSCPVHLFWEGSKTSLSLSLNVCACR